MKPSSHFVWLLCLCALVLWPLRGFAAPPVEGEGGMQFEFEKEAPPEGEGETEGEGEEGGEMVFEAQPEGEGEKKEGEGEKAPEGEGEWEFEVEDLSDDAAALEADLKEGEVQATGTVGTVKGTIFDTKGEPIPGAYIEVIGKKWLARSGVDGTYALKLPPGTYTLVARVELHKAVEQPGIVITANAEVEQKFELVPEGQALVVQVSADANVEGDAGVNIQRAKSVASSDVMSKDEIERAGGGRLADVTRRIVGATIVDGRFVFVRGLGHRYGNTLLDGARVPSPEPELRTVPLDIFPSAALGAIKIQKSFTPDVPGDFAGGSIQLETREVPTDLLIKLTVGIEANTVTTGQPMVTNGPFPQQDFWGFGNFPRGLANGIPTSNKAGRGIVNPDMPFEQLYTPDQIEAQGEAMYTDTRIRRGAKGPANYKFGATVGNGWSTPGNGKVGFLLTGNYKNKHETLFEDIKIYGASDGVIDTGTPQVDYKGIKTTNNVMWNGLGLFRWDVNPNHRIELSGLYSRDADDETRELRGVSTNVEAGNPITETRLRYIMRSILFTRLGARHRFPIFGGKHNIEWDYFGSFSQARRDDPAIRSMTFIIDPQNPNCDVGNLVQACNANLNSSATAPGPQVFLDLVDDNASVATNLAIPFDQWKGLETEIKVGAWAENKWRTFQTRRFTFPVAGMLNTAVPSGTGNIINDDTIGGGINAANGGTEPFVLNEATRVFDNYDARQQLYAGYAMMTLPFVRWFKVSGGARLEWNDIDVTPFDAFAPADQGPPDCENDDDDPRCKAARLTNLNVLPSLSLIFTPDLDKKLGTMNVRIMGSQTVARPEFRELAPFQFTDYAGGFTVKGNSNLEQTRIWNAEARWEWFPTPEEVVAVTGFYKYFILPIEQVANANSPPIISFLNAESATNAGAEFEVRKSWGFMAKKGTRAREVLSDFSLGANFAYVFSRVTLFPPCYDPADLEAGEDPPDGHVAKAGCDPAIEAVTSRERPLQGQSPFVTNVFLDYENDDIGTFVRVMFNTFGRRIFAVSAAGLPDIYEEPVAGMDLLFTQRLFQVKRDDLSDPDHELELEIGAINVLNPVIRRTQGDEKFPTYRTRRGVTFTTALSWNF